MAASSAKASNTARRWAWTGLKEWVGYRCGRLYHSFYYGQYTTKYALALVFPAVMWTTRFRTDTKLFYRVYIADEAAIPDKSQNALFDTKWTDGRKFFLPDEATVADLKEAVYGKGSAEKAALPGGETRTADLRVGCLGRMMEDSDNLALAVKSFCRRDPKLVIWKEEFL